MLLSGLVLLPLAGVIAIGLMPRAEDRACRHLGLFIALLEMLLSLGLFSFRLGESAFQFEVHYPWIASLGINFHLGIDGISLWLVLLTTFLTPIVVLSTYGAIETRIKEFIIAMLVLESGMVGAFLALDLFLFYVFWEMMLIPMYLLIGIWGHGRKVYAALKFVLYTVLGSLPMLLAIIYIYLSHGQATGDYTFDYTILMQSIWGHDAQLWLFAAFALAFAIKVPIFPLHTWLPDAHTQAPTAGSVILAGVLLKMGTYGFLRFALPMFPWATAAIGPYIAILAIIGIIFGAMVAYAQKDAKRLIAYSSVSHLGFVMLGMLAMNTVGISGSIFQMLAHGISTGGLFLAIGVLYQRRHTHALDAFGGLWRRMPVFASVFLIVMLASAGLPGLNGFVGEFMILVGSFTHKLIDGSGDTFFLIALPRNAAAWLGPRTLTACAALGVVLGAIYLLHLFQKIMLGPITHEENRTTKDLSAQEIATFLPLLVLIFVMGLYPQPFLRPMQASVDLYVKEYHAKYLASEHYEAPEPRRLTSLSYRSTIDRAQLSAPAQSDAKPTPDEEVEAKNATQSESEQVARPRSQATHTIATSQGEAR